ncbi:MAG: response regulator [Desulfotignum sp.]|nr:response regulator [Desulfotignum sp.]
MDDRQILENKRILVVDDEPDVLETMEELLHMCRVDTAGSFDTAVKHLDTHTYDAAVLDIMGVRGYEILEITRRMNLPTLMLTAHALTPENLETALEKGADAYIPKEKLVDISVFLADVLTARKQGRQANARWFTFVKPVFDKLFGPEWQKKTKIDV